MEYNELRWETVDKAPTDGRSVLAAFKGQFGWIVFIAKALPTPYGVMAPGYAEPTHFATFSTPDDDPITW